MMDRREALATLGKASFAGAGQKIAGLVDLFQTGAAPTGSTAKGTDAMDRVEEQMIADLKRLGTRVYSEEGIPMILACEDLGMSHGSALPAAASNAVLASAFERYAQAWHRLHPEATGNDVAKLVELLADKDFASGGKDTTL